ncbi:hypothetical protein STEG23_037723, partial [Scotinomys teguina]
SRTAAGDSSRSCKPNTWKQSNGTANKMNGALDHSDQPDPDAIKMFVGQIPRSWSEKELKELFEPYGAVYQINVLRDRSQNPPQSKGNMLTSHKSYLGYIVISEGLELGTSNEKENTSYVEILSLLWKNVEAMECNATFISSFLFLTLSIKCNKKGE